MERCCWYKTSFSSLARYLKNRIQYVRNREADVSRWLALPGQPAKVTSATISRAATTSIKPE
jgi:hypothetical protein